MLSHQIIAVFLYVFLKLKQKKKNNKITISSKADLFAFKIIFFYMDKRLMYRHSIYYFPIIILFSLWANVRRVMVVYMRDFLCAFHLVQNWMRRVGNLCFLVVVIAIFCVFVSWLNWCIVSIFIVLYTYKKMLQKRWCDERWQQCVLILNKLALI